MVDLSISADTTLLWTLIFAAALLYSSVGHAGASGYIAAMALLGTAPAIMKPTALVLNILVAALGTMRWHRLRLVNWTTLLPLLMASIPFAFIGGAMELPVTWYHALVGLLLLAAAAKLLFQPRVSDGASDKATNVPLSARLVSGGFVGFLSGLTGTGGGIFLSPILLFLGWAGPRQASGITAPFILFNSVAGLAGNLAVLKSLPAELPWFAIAALSGAFLGTQVGTRWASGVLLQRLLGMVLLVAGLKFLSV